jgi:2-polyprenyl-6-methoxyphenol hydroxylase-like FAD-dependent oxidoreductase
MAGVLFARAGCRTLVLEKHDDFLRDFRGDTVHPSTLEVMNELGLLDDFLARPHQRLTRLCAVFSGEQLELVDFCALKVACKFIAFMPQWHFLEFLADAGKSLPTFSLEMRAEVGNLIEEKGRVIGVYADTPEGPLEVRAKLVIGADGRDSTVRACADLKAENIGAPIDVLWFRVPCDSDAANEPLFNAGPGHIVVSIDRGDYYQCAFVIAKGGAETVKARGIEAFRGAVAATVPRLAGKVGAIKGFDDVKLLTVAIDRLRHWSRPGLLMIGDSAHAMSPIGGVGINLAIQDAVAAANRLAGPLYDGTLTDGDLEIVRRRRLWPVRATQFIQVQTQNRILAPILAGRNKTPRPPLLLRIVANTPWLKRRFAATIGLGIRPEHVHSPGRYTLAP